jgi:hypothetical protein
LSRDALMTSETALFFASMVYGSLGPIYCHVMCWYLKRVEIGTLKYCCWTSKRLRGYVTTTSEWTNAAGFFFFFLVKTREKKRIVLAGKDSKRIHCAFTRVHEESTSYNRTVHRNPDHPRGAYINICWTLGANNRDREQFVWNPPAGFSTEHSSINNSRSICASPAVFTERSDW